MMHRSRRCVALVLALLPFSLATAQESIPTYTQGLRERRLDQLLEAYCQKQLSDPNLTELARSFFSIEHANLILDKSTTIADKTKREKLWTQAHEILKSAVQASTDTSIVMELQ